VSAKVSYFSGYSVVADVNEFLAKNSYEVEDVRVQFITTRYQDNQYREDSATEAYVTHPA